VHHLATLRPPLEKYWVLLGAELGALLGDVLGLLSRSGCTRRCNGDGAEATPGPDAQVTLGPALGEQLGPRAWRGTGRLGPALGGTAKRSGCGTRQALGAREEPGLEAGPGGRNSLLMGPAQTQHRSRVTLGAALGPATGRSTRSSLGLRS
jgi:hypothetical protein